MGSMSTAYIVVGIFVLAALLLNIQWLFLSMSLLLVALAVGDSLSHSSTHSHASHTSHAPEMEKKTPPVFMDNLLASLILDKHRAKREKAEKEEAKKEEEKKKEKDKEKK